MLTDGLLQEFDEDDRFYLYHPIHPIKIFGFELESSECEISISRELDLKDIVSILAKYLEWLSLCEDKLTDYLQSQMDETLSEDWYKSIEVYNTDITFITLEDFGATIGFGANIFIDHIIEIDVDKYDIVDCRLNG